MSAIIAAASIKVTAVVVIVISISIIVAAVDTRISIRPIVVVILRASHICTRMILSILIIMWEITTKLSVMFICKRVVFDVSIFGSLLIKKFKPHFLVVDGFNGLFQYKGRLRGGHIGKSDDEC